VHTPYAADAVSCFLAAQWGAAALLLALVLFARLPIASKCALMAAVGLAGLAPALGPMMDSIGHPVEPLFLRKALAWSIEIAALGALLGARLRVAGLAALSLWPLVWVSEHVTESDPELAALTLAWLGLLVGLLARRPDRCPWPMTPAVEGSYAVHDAAVFAAATTLAALCGSYVLDRRDGSADEWAYAFQAAVFAKGRAFSEAPRCQTFLENFYVYEDSGRLFSLYTPGWSMVMVPFVWARCIWLSGPFSMGFMAWSLARLGRSAAREFGAGETTPSRALIRASGTLAAAVAMLGTTILENGGSRYPHVFMAGLYAWSLEGLLMASSAGLSARRQFLWGAVLGSACSMMLATRPAEGVFLGLGVAVLFVYTNARLRFPWRAFVAATAAFGFVTVLTLVILRLQLGRWFVTGYSLMPILQPWQAVKYSWPKPNEWKYGIPLATGAYCWWPCSLPLGLAGMAMLRGRARGLAVAFAVGALSLFTFLSYLEFGRGFDWGYGPRYVLVLVVPMAVGSGIALARFAVAARERLSLPGRTAFLRGAPLGIALLAMATSWLRIVPSLWPPVYQHTHRHSGVNRAIEQAHLTNAVVIATDGTTGFDERDLTTNLPVDLYPNQDAIIGIHRRLGDEAYKCLRSAYPGRRFYDASGSDEVKLTPRP
jgi:hypothetical protein